MPVNIPPAQKNWGAVLDAGDQPVTWGNVSFLDYNFGEGAVRAVFTTANGGAIWMQGGIHWQYWRLDLEGTLHRFIRQPSGSLILWRSELRNGQVVYNQKLPFGGGTAGDRAYQVVAGRTPFHVTDASSGVTWFYDDTGGASFGVDRFGAVLVFDLNLTPDGPVPADGVNTTSTNIHVYDMLRPAYLGALYGGRILPQQPVSMSRDRAGMDTERSVPYRVPPEYFTNLSLPDDRIHTMSAAALATIYYGILNPEMQGNCPHYIPSPEFSKGLSEFQAYCNEMDIRMRIYSLRPDMHFITDAKAQKVVGLVDPLKIPMYNGMRCKESLLATIGLSAALALVTAGAGAILPVLGTFANLAKFGASVSDLFAQRDSVQEMLAFKDQVQTGITGLLQQTTPLGDVITAAPQPVTRSTQPSTGSVTHAESQSNFPLALLVIPVFLLL